MKRLASRNLRRGYRLNIPSAQGVIEAINATGLYRPIPVLTPEQVSEGRDFLTAPGLDAATPLWFYVLREAELVGGNHLGALGSQDRRAPLVAAFVPALAAHRQPQGDAAVYRASGLISTVPWPN